MKIKLSKVFGFNVLRSTTIVFVFFTIIFIVLSILGLAYGIWAAFGIFLAFAALFLCYVGYVWYGAMKTFKPFKSKNTKIVDVKITAINLRGWEQINNLKFTGVDENGKEVNGLVLITWTNAKLDAGQIVKCYNIGDKYLMLKP